MSERDTIPAEVRAMKTSELVGAIATHRTLAIVERLIGGATSQNKAVSEALTAIYAAELDARILPREVPHD